MRLVKLTIDSFKTVATQQTLILDPHATILIGANESGKTNVLEAIKFLSVTEELTPTCISKCNADKYKQKILPVLTYTFLPTNDEMVALYNLIPDLKGETEICIQRFGNGLHGFSLKFPKNELIEKRKVARSDLTQKMMALQNELVNLGEEIEIKQAKLHSLKLKNDNESPGVQNLINELSAKIVILRRQSADNTNILIEQEKELKKIDAEKKFTSEGMLSLSTGKLAQLLEMLPTVFFVNELDLLPESIPIDEVKAQSTPTAKLVGNLLRLGKFNNLADLDQNYRQLKPVLRDVSARVSELFSSFYSQEKVEIEIEKQGTDVLFSINGGVSLSSSPIERSIGFQWILGFFARLAPKYTSHHGLLLLIDEPAIHLHPRAQKDIVKMIEKITDTYQIVYSTHSPFLINKNFPQRIRLLVKDREKGTEILNKPYSVSKVSFWEPLKSAIGLNLGDMLSLGECNLIVEGISDSILIVGISKKFADLNLPFLDLEEISVVPAMGATRIEPLARLASIEGLNTISLLDNDSEGKKIFAKLSEDKQLKLISVEKFKKGAITIEDLLPEKIYVECVNRLYSQFNDYKEFVSDEKGEKTGIIERVSKHLEKNGNYELDKVGVAKELINTIKLTEKNKDDYKPFSDLINLLNGTKKEAVKMTH